MTAPRFIYARGQAGFTLFETLTSLMVATLLLSLASFALFSLTQGRAQADTKAQALRQMTELALFFEQTLGQAQAYAPDDRSNDLDAPALAGDEDTLIFYAPAPDALGVVGVARYVLSKGQSGGYQLSLSTTLPWSDPESWSSELFDGVQSLALRYWDGERESRQWRNEDSLPKAIFVAIELQGSQSRPLNFIIRLEARIHPACVFDSIGRTCRRRRF